MNKCHPCHGRRGMRSAFVSSLTARTEIPYCVISITASIDFMLAAFCRVHAPAEALPPNTSRKHLLCRAEYDIWRGGTDSWWGLLFERSLLYVYPYIHVIWIAASAVFVKSHEDLGMRTTLHTIPLWWRLLSIPQVLYKFCTELKVLWSVVQNFKCR